mmetsp:Transcript_96175/g.206360  ORF Transcript_96175/g.206360 Transcript_96175/m.206360 type:complete len:322 (-) Transcript_96175:63-1028(-)
MKQDPVAGHGQQFSQNYARVRVISLFLAHACCSISLVLMNKTISVNFPFTWTIVILQNSGTIVCSAGLHLVGKVVIKPLRQHQVLPIAVDALLLCVVLWSSVKALEVVSVPLYVVVRNTVPFLTAICERVALKRQLDFMLFVALLVTFAGTVLYSVSDFSTPLRGAAYALANAVLVAVMCVYERYLMTSSQVEMTAIDLNFHRVVLSMPLIALCALTEGFPVRLLDLAVQPREAALLFLSAAAAFGIGTLLLELQTQVSATTIQVANVSYKCATTMVSRLTHPAEITPLGVVGYLLTTVGVLLYTLSRSRASSGSGSAKKA